MVGKGELPERALSVMEAAALQNAARHGGKAEVGAVVGRILAEFPDLRASSGEVARAAKAMVDRVNAMTLSEQESALRGRFPETGARAEKDEGRVGLPPLSHAMKGQVAFRMPPEPSGFMTVGHAMAFTINSVYASTYEGELWLRFEDTNPRKVATKYYDSFRQGIAWLGIRWDHEKNVSDDLDVIYGHGERLISEGKAYACSCGLEKMKALRSEGKPCEHSGLPSERSLSVWERMLARKVKEGDAVIRFLGDMESLDYSLRDPSLFRVIERRHPVTGDRFTVWPTYDLSNVVEDQICGITHILRSSEFGVALQARLREALGFRAPDVIQFSRFNFKGSPVQKRRLRPLVEEGLVSGWDDPRMPTVEGLRRRGVIPEAIREFTLHVGYTKSEHEYDWSLLLSINRKLLDPSSKRVYFVPDPVELAVEGAPTKAVTIRFHPDAALGERAIRTSGRFLVPSADIGAMPLGTTFRLMELYNVELTRSGANPAGRYAGEELTRDTRKLQWVVPPGLPVKVLEPGLLFNEEGVFNKDSMLERQGVAEQSFEELKTGDIIQFPRVGFCRVDSAGTCILSQR